MISAEQPIPRTDLALPRFLAVILFGLAAFMGLPTVAAAVGSILSGKWRAALLISSVLPVVWVTGWLGTVLWSGRMIPRWFMTAFSLVIVGGVFVAALFSSTWLESLAMFALILPSAFGIYSAVRNYPGTPPKPKMIDELA